MNQLPDTFWAQAGARLLQSQPKFYQIILKNSLLITALAFAIPYITTDILPGMGVEVPAWATFLNGEFIKWRTILMGAGIGSALVAKTTLQTAGTPPLVTEEKPKDPDVSALVTAEVERQMAEYRALNPPAKWTEPGSKEQTL